jgi:hypothetical protein
VPGVNWETEYFNLLVKYAALSKESANNKDTERLKFIANIDDGEVLSEIEDTDYRTWCLTIDEAIKLHHAMERHDTVQSEWDEFDEDDDDSSYEFAVGFAVDTMFDKLVASAIVGVVFYLAASYFVVPWAIGLGVVAAMFCMLELWNKEMES